MKKIILSAVLAVFSLNCAYANFGAQLEYGVYEASHNDFSNIDKTDNVLQKSYDDASNCFGVVLFYEHSYLIQYLYRYFDERGKMVKNDRIKLSGIYPPPMPKIKKQ